MSDPLRYSSNYHIKNDTELLLKKIDQALLELKEIKNEVCLPPLEELPPRDVQREEYSVEIDDNVSPK